MNTNISSTFQLNPNLNPSKILDLFSTHRNGLGKDFAMPLPQIDAITRFFDILSKHHQFGYDHVGALTSYTLKSKHLKRACFRACSGFNFLIDFQREGHVFIKIAEKTKRSENGHHAHKKIGLYIDTFNEKVVVRATGNSRDIPLIEKEVLELIGSKPGVVKTHNIYHYVTRNNRVFKTCVWMKYYVNGTLVDYLSKNKATLKQRINLYLGAATGIEQCALKGYAVNDVKPDNVLVDKKLQSVICDFGQSYLVEDRPESLNGTLLYISPEVIRSKDPLEIHLSYQRDVYAFGLLIAFSEYPDFKEEYSKQLQILCDECFSQSVYDQFCLWRKKYIGEIKLRSGAKSIQHKLINLVDSILNGNLEGKKTIREVLCELKSIELKRKVKVIHQLFQKHRKDLEEMFALPLPPQSSISRFLLLKSSQETTWLDTAKNSLSLSFRPKIEKIKVVVDSHGNVLMSIAKKPPKDQLPENCKSEFRHSFKTIHLVIDVAKEILLVRATAEKRYLSDKEVELVELLKETPGIVRFHYVDDYLNQFECLKRAVLMPYYSKGSLSYFLHRAKPNIKTRVGIYHQVARILLEIKSLAVHADIKDENIFIDNDLKPIIGDFGLGYEASNIVDELKGSPTYISYNIWKYKGGVFEGNHPFGHERDWHALAFMILNIEFPELFHKYEKALHGMYYHQKSLQYKVTRKSVLDSLLNDKHSCVFKNGLSLLVGSILINEIKLDIERITDHLARLEGQSSKSSSATNVS